MESKKYSAIVVVDHAWGGHIPTYHKYICKSLLQLGYTVHSVSPNPLEVEQWMNENEIITHSAISYNWWPPAKSAADAAQTTAKQTPNVNQPKKQNFKQRLIASFTSLPVLKNIFKVHEVWRTIQKITAQIAPDTNNTFVIIPYMSRAVLAPGYAGWLLTRVFHYPWSALYLHPFYLRTGHGNAKWWLKIFKANSCKSIALLDEGLIDKVQAIIKKPVVQFPDITNNVFDAKNLTPLAQQILQKANGRKIVSVIGVINTKKNLFTLLQAVKLSTEQNLPFYFLIAGEGNRSYWSPETDYDVFMETVKQFPETIFSHFQRVNDGQHYNSLISISDILLGSYKNFYHSSNTLTKAAIFKKPVVVSKGYLMEERVVKYDLGIAVQEDDPKMLLTALQQLAAGNNLQGRKLLPQYETYYNLHAYSRLSPTLAQMIV